MLPSFPKLTGRITEKLIERTAERLMDIADIALMSGVARQGAYDEWCLKLDKWTAAQRMKE